MAGINRLGKGAPKPRIHAPDLNRNRTLDFFSEETGKLESDRDYQRTVQDIEDAAQTQGWLFSRGAFDKTDLLYLRDQEEKSRHTEMELHDREVLAYARLRMQNDKQKTASSGLGIASKKIDRNARPAGRVAPRVIKISRPGGTAAGGAAGGAEAQTAAQHCTDTPQQPNKASDSGGLGDLVGGYGSGSDSEPEGRVAAVEPTSLPSPTAAPAALAAAAAAADGLKQEEDSARLTRAAATSQAHADEDEQEMVDYT